jgi:tetratricopeptide (TPR) repeat protein
MLSTLFRSLLRNSERQRRARRANALFDAGLALKDLQDFDGARRKFEEALALNPHHGDAHHWLGVMFARDPSRYADAVRHIELALAVDPLIPDGWIDLGTVHYLMRDFPKAATCFRAALEAAPDSSMGHANLGLALKEAGRVQEALVHLRRAHELAPETEGTLRSLVASLIESEAYEEALRVSENAVTRRPASYVAQFCLGFARQKADDLSQALTCYDKALEYRSDDPELHNNRGSTLQFLGRMEEARASYERAIEVGPDFLPAIFHRGLLHLMRGDYARGWPDFEMRLLSKEHGDWPAFFERWDGSELTGRTLLVRREQGLGDEMMFASCLPEVISGAGHCVIECAPKLERLFRRSFPKATVYAAAPGQTIPEAVRTRGVDYEIFAGSLPLFYRRDAAAFPRHGGYLKADPPSVERWRERLAALGDGLKIGISWRGGVPRTRRSVRSVELDGWLPVLSCPGARFVSLQYDNASADLARLAERHGIGVTHWPEAIDDYDQTAALVCALDLVISVCTAVIHLGGALGRPVWVMAPYSPEWRYGFTGDTMPWYPSVRLFRQPAFGEWQPVVADVAAELGRLIGSSAK